MIALKVEVESPIWSGGSAHCRARGAVCPASCLVVPSGHPVGWQHLRHLDTRHSLTGAVLWSFTYDAAGRLTALTDWQNRPSVVPKLFHVEQGRVSALTDDAASAME
jgi:YD repeat-containing protein